MTEEFRRKLEATFHEEASEHLHILGSGLIDWEKEGGDAASGLSESLFRSVHSLKGASRAVGYLEMESVCQALEGVFSALRKNRAAMTEGIFDTFNRARAQLERMLAARRRGQPPLAPEPELLEHLKALESGLDIREADTAAGQQGAAGSQGPAHGPAETVGAAIRGPETATIRVPVDKLEELSEGINTDRKSVV